MSENLHHVVIIGGGFAGLNAAKALRRAPVRITLIDRRNHHLFQPLLYQVATGGLSPADIAEPIRTILRRQDNVTVLLGEARSIRPKAHEVELEDGTVLRYDHLILAAGAVTAYFGNDDWAERAPGLKNLEDAVTIRRRFLLAFERAEREEDPERRRELLTFVIVGAGPTGVELAGTMSEMSRNALPGSYRTINADDARVILVEGAERVLTPYDPISSKRAQDALKARGVELRLDSRVSAIEEGVVVIGDERITCGNIFWAAGVSAEAIVQTFEAPTDWAGRVQVTPYCTAPHHPDVFVVGDAAYLKDAEGKVVPGVAQGAIQTGIYAADVIKARLAGKPIKPFVYFDKGQLATIGRAAAVAEVAGAKMSGFFAWLMWLVIHVAFLIGFDNKLIVLIQWTWDYFAYKRGSLLITDAYQGYAAPPALNSDSDDDKRIAA